MQVLSLCLPSLLFARWNSPRVIFKEFCKEIGLRLSESVRLGFILLGGHRKNLPIAWGSSPANADSRKADDRKADDRKADTRKKQTPKKTDTEESPRRFFQ